MLDNHLVFGRPLKDVPTLHVPSKVPCSILFDIKLDSKTLSIRMESLYNTSFLSITIASSSFLDKFVVVLHI